MKEQFENYTTCYQKHLSMSIDRRVEMRVSPLFWVEMAIPAPLIEVPSVCVWPRSGPVDDHGY
jgi:hypothetical protein